MASQRSWYVFSVLHRAGPLLAHFVRHYAQIGFTDLVLAVHEQVVNPEVLEEVKRLSPLRIHIERCYRGVQTGGRDALLCNGLRALYIDGQDWHAVADLDEFYEYPHPLSYIAENGGECNCLVGNYSDRVAPGGYLNPVTDTPDIATQFPIETEVTRVVLGILSRKVMLCRGDRSLLAGHHTMADEKLLPYTGKVHHYKWHKGVIEQLIERVNARRATEPRFMEAIDRVIAYLERNGGRINLADCVPPTP